MLADDSWKYDVMPEFYNGKNVADFVDPDIEAKLEALEREEDALAEQGFYKSDEEGMVRPANVYLSRRLTRCSSTQKKRSSAMLLSRFGARKRSLRCFPRTKTSFKIAQSSHGKTSMSHLPNSLMVCENTGTTHLYWKDEPRDWSCKRRPLGKRQKPQPETRTWIWRANLLFQADDRSEVKQSTGHPERTGSMLVWRLLRNQARRTSFEILLRGNPIGWRRRASRIGISRLRGRSGCWRGRGREGRHSGGEERPNYKSFVIFVCIAQAKISSDLFRTKQVEVSSNVPGDVTFSSFCKQSSYFILKCCQALEVPRAPVLG